MKHIFRDIIRHLFKKSAPALLALPLVQKTSSLALASRSSLALALALSFTLVSCDYVHDMNLFTQTKDKGAAIRNANFSNYYKTMDLKIDITPDFNSFERLDDTTKVMVRVKDSYRYLAPVIEPTQPKVSHIRYVASQQLAWADFDCIVLVDLCQPSAVIQKEHNYVRGLSRIFEHGNLFIAFMMPNGKVTNVIPATQYVIDNYINVNAPILGYTLNLSSGSGRIFSSLDSQLSTAHQQDSVPATMQHAYLFRSVGHILSDAMSHTGTAYDSSKHKIMMILSDGQVYNENNMPIDPQHFQMQERLITLSKRTEGNVHVYYYSLSNNPDVTLADNSMMQMLCRDSGGRFMRSFNWNAFQNYIAEDFRYPLTDYELTLEYQPGSLFLGNERYVQLDFVSKKTKKVLATCHRNYKVGNVYRPIIVGESDYSQMFIAGCFLALVLLFFIYVYMQFLLPYIKYRQFKKKYLHKYVGPNMSIEGRLVSSVCYYCKAPFKIGDDIVAKCQHTMHRSCWEENGQHCPEYRRPIGRDFSFLSAAPAVEPSSTSSHNCFEGAYFYNHQNLLDPRNASFYLKWVLGAFLAGFIAWFLFEYSTHYYLINFLQETASSIISEEEDILIGIGARQCASSELYYLVVLANIVSFFVTFPLALLASYHRVWYKRIIEVILRCCCVQLVSLFLFYLEFCGLMALNLNDTLVILDIIPWSLMSMVIIFGATHGSRIKLNSRWIVLGGLAAGVWGTFTWTLCGMQESFVEVFSTIPAVLIYCIILGCTIARPLPASDHAFLHVTGEIKEMDIALYKWLRQTDNAVVSIGRSVDCSLQLSWDTQSDIAPVQAQIRQSRGAVYITSLEAIPEQGRGVIINSKFLPERKWKRLYHGDTFHIGTTNFMYVEM